MPKNRSPRRRFSRPKPQTHSPRGRPRWLVVLAAVSIAAVGAMTYAALQLPILRVQDVTVVGTESLDTQAVVELSGLRDQSMLRLDLDRARQRLLEVPQVKAISFTRTWPGRVTVRVTERVPWGFWSVGGKNYPVDFEGVVLATGAPSRESTRIIEPDTNRVMGPGDRVDPDAIALADRIFRESPSVLGRGVRELEYRAGVGITVVFSNGLRVTFGDDRAYEYKFAVLSRLLEELRQSGKTPQAIDLRFGERVTYQ